MSLLALETKRVEIEAAIDELKKSSAEKFEELKSELAETRRLIALQSGGLNLDTLHHAEHVIEVRGDYKRNPSVITDAIASLVKSRGAEMKQQYFGAKDYSGWSGQRSNHEYGYGPKHGGIVLSCGLTKEARKRELTDEEIEAALYYLNNIEAVQSAATKSQATS